MLLWTETRAGRSQHCFFDPCEASEPLVLHPSASTSHRSHSGSHRMDLDLVMQHAPPCSYQRPSTEAGKAILETSRSPLLSCSCPTSWSESHQNSNCHTPASLINIHRRFPCRTVVLQLSSPSVGMWISDFSNATRWRCALRQAASPLFDDEISPAT